MPNERDRAFLHALFLLRRLLGAELRRPVEPGSACVSMAEYILMRETLTSQGGSVDLAHIRDYLAVSKAAVSQMLSSLERRGLIARRADPANRRNLLLALTPAGETALREKDAEADRRLAQVAAMLGEEDMRQLTRIISKANAAMRAGGDAGSERRSK